jgi:hypothetical protein
MGTLPFLTHDSHSQRFAFFDLQGNYQKNAGTMARIPGRVEACASVRTCVEVSEHFPECTRLNA